MHLIFIFENVRCRIQIRACREFKSVFTFFFFILVHAIGRTDGTAKVIRNTRKSIFGSFGYEI